MDDKKKESIQDVIKAYLHGERKIHKDNLFIVLLVGILLLVIAIPTSESTTDLQGKESAEATQLAETTQEKMQKELADFLMSIEGVGEAKVLIHMQTQRSMNYGSETENSKITGVIISAQGATQEFIRLRIINLVMALYSLDADDVDVYPMK